LFTGVSIQRADAIATLAIEGRSGLNLLGLDVFRSLSERVSECGGDENLRAIVLRGAGDRAFSAGVDLRQMKDLDPLAAEIFIRTLHAAARSLLNAPLPVVAAIRGPCLGGALELALACDIRVASDDAIFGLPEVKVGLPSVIEASLLPPTVGLGRARRLILTGGETIDAEAALSIGLIDQIVPAGQLYDAALDVARGFLNMSRYVLATQKQVASRWLEVGGEEAAEYSIKAFALCFATPFPNEAMTAFLEKREPRF
jgi:enoyl-CoA hydratase